MPDASPSTSLTYYPAFCWPASPTYKDWVKLSAADVHSLATRRGFEGQRVLFCKNHPIQFVRLVGLVTSFDDATSTTTLAGPQKVAKTSHTPWNFTLDDGSGENIDVICWPSSDEAQGSRATRPDERVHLGFADLHKRAGRTHTGKNISLDEVELGRVVKVKGHVDEFRGRRQILLEKVEVVKDTAAEVVAWSDLADFQRDVLAKPWVLSRERVGELRRQEEWRQRKLAKAEKRKRVDDGAGVGDPGDAEKTHRIRIVPAKKQQDDAVRQTKALKT